MDYFIVNVTPYSYETLAIFDSYDEADQNQEHFCNVYPHGYIDILSEEELIDAAQLPWNQSTPRSLRLAD